MNWRALAVVTALALAGLMLCCGPQEDTGVKDAPAEGE